MKKYNTLILMPYLPLGGSIKFNNLFIWSFKNYKDKIINDIPLKSHIQKLVDCYQFHNKHPIDNPSIITVGDNLFSNPTNKTIQKIEALKNILLFTSILENNQWSFTTSDNFEVFYQRFNVGDQGIATSAGAIHHIATSGYKLDEIAFVKPEHIYIPFNVKIRSSILRALEDCLKNSDLDINKSRVIQSLNPFFNSYRNGSEHSWASRVLLLIMSFELLFGETGRPSFRDNILKYSTEPSLSHLKQNYHNYPIYNYKKITSYEQLSLTQIWAEEFYKLRHKIIHGDTVYSDDFLFKDLLGITKIPQPHFYIAINFFIVCTLNILREIGYLNIPHYVINPNFKPGLFDKNISGIKDEIFKIEDIDLYDLIKNI